MVRGMFAERGTPDRTHTRLDAIESRLDMIEKILCEMMGRDILTSRDTERGPGPN